MEQKNGGRVRIIPLYPYSALEKVEQDIRDAVPLSAEGTIMIVEAAPGGPTPVLAIRKAPPWACEAVVAENRDGLKWAVPLALQENVRLVTVAKALSAMLGDQEVTEVTEGG